MIIGPDAISASMRRSSKTESLPRSLPHWKTHSDYETTVVIFVQNVAVFVSYVLCFVLLENKGEFTDWVSNTHIHSPIGQRTLSTSSTTSKKFTTLCASYIKMEEEGYKYL